MGKSIANFKHMVRKIILIAIAEGSVSIIFDIKSPQAR